MAIEHRCELCEELSSGKAPAAICGQARTRRLGDDWCVMPSLGPVSPVHILLLPQEHVPFALRARGAIEVVEHFRAALVTAVGARKVLLFEHANSPTGCGITHAHVHGVVIPEALQAQELFGGFDARATSLVSMADETRELFWFATAHCAWLAADISMASQWARRAVAKANDVEFNADWKAYTHEPWFESSRRVADELAAVLRQTTCPVRPAA